MLVLRCQRKHHRQDNDDADGEEYDLLNAQAAHFALRFTSLLFIGHSYYLINLNDPLKLAPGQG